MRDLGGAAVEPVFSTQRTDDNWIQTVSGRQFWPLRFDLTWPMPDCVHDADLRALAAERRELMAPPPRPWKSTAGIDAPNCLIESWSPEYAKACFLERFRELAG